MTSERYLYGPTNGFVIPDKAEVKALPKGIRKYTDRIAPQGKRCPDGMWRSVPDDDFAYDVYLTNEEDELWVRRATPSVFRMQVHTPPGLSGEIERVIYNSSAGSAGVYEFGDYGAAISIESGNPEEIVSIHKTDDPEGYQRKLKFVSCLLLDKLLQRNHYREFYLSRALGGAMIDRAVD